MGTVRQYHKIYIQRVLQKNIKRVSNQKYCQNNIQKYQGVSQSKELPGTAIIKSTARDATIKSTARECHNKVHPGSATNRSTTRGCHNQNDH